MQIQEVPKLIEKLAEAEVKILMELQDGKEMVLSKFIGLKIGYGTIYRALGNLEIMGLTSERADGNRRFLSLTEKGKVVATKLKDIDIYLKSK